jgi:hypothetical protein
MTSNPSEAELQYDFGTTAGKGSEVMRLEVASIPDTYLTV